MSKDAPDLHNLPLTQETPATQASLETFNAFLNAPVTKLDADEYKASDIDGVTEGLLGSGNLNFLMMQAGQTDEAMVNSNPFDIASSDINLTPANLLGGNSYSPLSDSGARGDNATDRTFDMPNALDGLADSGLSGLSNNAGTLGAFSAAANSASMNPLSDTSFYSNTGTNGGNGNDGGNGGNGTNGRDGEGGGDVTNITNNTTNITENTTIDNSVTIIDNSILENVENIYNDTTNLLTEIVNNTYDTVNNIFNEFPFDIGPIGISLDAALDDLLNLDLDFINGDQILTVLDEVIDLSPVTNLVEGLTGDILANVGLDVILDPFQYDSSASDYDVHVGLDVLGLNPPGIDIPLDPVEFLLGDIDIGLDVGQDILGLLPPILGGADNGDTNLDIPILNDIALLAPVTGIVDGLFNPVEDLVGDIDVLGNLHVDLLNLGTDSTGPDTDITIPLDLNLIGSDLLGDQIEISLDPVESLLGDIDLDLGVAANLLGDTADGLIDNLSGGTGTDNILADLGNTLGDVVGNILPMGGEAGDTDILLSTDLGIPGTELLSEGGEILLDPVENLLGDIDVTADTNLDLFNVGDSQSASDTDLSLNIDLIDADLNPITVNLDMVEAITGDIDLDLDVSADIIDMVSDPTTILDGLLDIVDNTIDTAVGLLDNLPANTGGLDLGALLPSDGGGVGDILPWTETILPDPGNLLGGGLLGGLTDILPDPVSAAPVIPLPIIPVLPVPHLGGSGHFGGLFG